MATRRWTSGALRLRARGVVVCGTVMAWMCGAPASNAATLRVGAAPWGDHATIEAAVAAAVAGDEVWVQGGTYALTAQIMLDKAVALYGGFEGHETARDERDWTAFETVIDGQNVTRCLMVTADAVIDGFTIRNGKDAAEYSDGGGIYVDGASPTIAHCLIADNSAAWRGGAMFIDDASPTIDHCTFSGNQSGGEGGAMITTGSSSPVVSDSTFSGNEALYTGGAIYVDYGSSPTVQRCQLSQNGTTHDDMSRADSSGGAIFVSSHSGILIEDSTFTENTAHVYGGAIYANNWGSSLPTTIRRCRFIQNSTPFVGGGVFMVHAVGGITNSMFLENSASSGGAMSVFNTSGWSVVNSTYLGNTAGVGASLDVSDSEIALVNSIVWGPGSHIDSDYSTLTVSYSDVQGSGGSVAWNAAYGTDGGGNIDADPLFQSSADVHLADGSPCIDSGDPDPAFNDRDGSRNDMGAYGGGEAEVPALTLSIGPASVAEGDSGATALVFTVTVAE